MLGFWKCKGKVGKDTILRARVVFGTKILNAEGAEGRGGDEEKVEERRGWAGGGSCSCAYDFDGGMEDERNTTLNVRVVAWNLRHGGGNTRTPEQGLFLNSLGADVACLSEVREARGSQLRVMLADAGLVHWVEPRAVSVRNRVVIASRFALRAVAEEVWRERFVAARIEELGLTVMSVHVPDENNETARAEVWRLVVGQAIGLKETRVIVAGDFNTQRSSPDAHGLEGHATVRTAWRGGRRVGQTCERMMGMLATHGYVDVTSPSVASQQPTWFGPSGERHAIDGIWASTSLISAGCEAARVMPSAFRETRCVEEKLSDHAAIGVDFHIDFDPKNRVFGDAGVVAKAEQGGLFA